MFSGINIYISLFFKKNSDLEIILVGVVVSSALLSMRALVTFPGWANFC